MFFLSKGDMSRELAAECHTPATRELAAERHTPATRKLEAERQCQYTLFQGSLKSEEKNYLHILGHMGKIL